MYNPSHSCKHDLPNLSLTTKIHCPALISAYIRHLIGDAVLCKNLSAIGLLWVNL